MIKNCLIILLILASPYCYAWDSMGHRVIAEIAYNHLDGKAKEETNNLIDYMADAYPYNSSIQTASNWADAIKDDDVHTFDNWHYIDQPISTNSTPTPPINNTNIVWAINQCIDVLKSPKSNEYEKSFFLRFLMHLVGDASQPLHAATRYSENFPNGDEGGNLFMTNNGHDSNLHGYWDNGLGFFEKNCNLSISKAGQARCLSSKIQIEYPESYFGSKTTDLDPNDWVKESYLIAKNFAYNTPDNKPLSQEYTNQGQVLVEQQLALAGYHLANLLNSIFG
jgi:hypothetical protein